MHQTFAVCPRVFSGPDIPRYAMFRQIQLANGCLSVGTRVTANQSLRWQSQAQLTVASTWWCTSRKLC